MKFSESEFEDNALEWLFGLGRTVFHRPQIARGDMFAERQDFDEATQTVLAQAELLCAGWA